MIYLLLFIEFFKIGLFTFGGGYAMIPLLKETCLAYNWMDEESLYSFIGIAESTPGPIAVNLATFVGYSQANILGAVVATLGVVTPAFIIIILIACLLSKIMENKYVKGFLNGVKPVAIGLILVAGLSLFSKSLGFTSINEFSLNLSFLICFGILSVFYIVYLIIGKKKINSILFILIAAIFGIGISYLVA
jgi:chromate transporter